MSRFSYSIWAFATQVSPVGLKAMQTWTNPLQYEHFEDRFNVSIEKEMLVYDRPVCAFPESVD